MTKNKLCLLYICIIFVFFGGVSPAAADFYVDIANCPGGSGTVTDPYCSIQSGIGAAFTAGGGVVHVAQGTYPENLNLRDKVQIIGADAETTIIDGGGTGSVIWGKKGVRSTLDPWWILCGN